MELIGLYHGEIQILFEKRRAMEKGFYVLTIDLEDWFFILDIEEEPLKCPDKYEIRIYEPTYKILELLTFYNQKATFFVPGWIAKKHSSLIKKINDLGFDIGTHSYAHTLVYKQTKEEFGDDLKRSIKILQDLTGKDITSYRSPGFSITQNSLWALEFLVKYGIEIDSSVFPARRGHGGLNNFKYDKPCIIEYKGLKLKEFPMRVMKLPLGIKLFITGGGYFRLFPYRTTRNFLKTHKDYAIIYLHPRDFDDKQPRMKMPYLRKFKSYVNIRRTLRKFEKMLNEFNFTDIKTADTLIDWEKVPIIKVT